MKKLFLLFAAVGMILTACQSGGDAWKENGKIPVTSQIKLSQQVFDVGCEPATYSVLVTSPHMWIAESMNDWIEVETTTGIVGTVLLSFKIDLNASLETRKGTIVVKNSDYNLAAELHVVQEALDPNFAVMYTSSDGLIVTPYSGEYNNNATAIDTFGANILSNTYEKGKGILVFDAPVISIGWRAFYNCTSLTRVTFPDSVTSIGYGAFQCCRSLASITIPDSVTSIEKYAFGFSSLRSITIPNSVTEIGDYAFRDCVLLKRVDITDLSAWCKISFGDNLANPLNNGAKLYLNGSELTDITIPSDITEIKAYAFRGCTSLTSVTIGDSVTSIGKSAFYECSSLTSVTIGNGVTSIGSTAFSDCTSLTSVTIGNNVTSIGVWAFSDCTSLTSITIPDSVTSIGNYAFEDCTSLTSVYCKPTTPPTGGFGAFSYHIYNNSYITPIGCKIYVPRKSVDAYKSELYWEDYAYYIVGYNF